MNMKFSKKARLALKVEIIRDFLSKTILNKTSFLQKGLDLFQDCLLSILVRRRKLAWNEKNRSIRKL